MSDAHHDSTEGNHWTAETSLRTSVVAGTPEAQKKFAEHIQPNSNPFHGLVDNGEREIHASGAIREPAAGRGRFDLIPIEPMMRLARHYEAGALKYAERNWEKGLSVKDCYNSMQRHMWKYAAGMNEEDHLAAIVWNAFAIMTYEARMPELVDISTRPEYKERQEKE